MSGLFVNCDWGTTALRLRLASLGPHQILAEFRSTSGVAELAAQAPIGPRAERFQQVLCSGLAELSRAAGSELNQVPIVISGMASSSLGWRELPYASLPCRLDGQGLGSVELDPLLAPTGPHRVLLISGLRSETDVLRGEETEILGLFQLPQVAGLNRSSLVIKPGTHSKHLRVEAGQITGFHTFMTGELFDLLARHSVLRHSVSEPEEISTPPELDLPTIRQAVKDAQAAPLSAALFRVRTRQLLQNAGPASNRQYLSGLLVASELACLASSPLKYSAGCVIAWMQSQNSDASRYSASRAELCSEPGEVEISHDGLIQQAASPPGSDMPLILCAAAAHHAVYLAVADELGLSGRMTLIDPQEVDQLSARGQALVWQRHLAGGLTD